MWRGDELVSGRLAEAMKQLFVTLAYASGGSAASR